MFFAKYLMRSLGSCCLFLFLLQPESAFALRLDQEEVRTILDNVAIHLEKMQLTSGRYQYEFNPFTGDFTDDDNVVRQVGTLQSMSELYKVFEDEKYLERLKKTADYWLEQSVRDVTPDGLVLRYIPNEVHGDEAKTGTMALFIVGTRVLKEVGDPWWLAHEQEMSEIENAIFWLQKADGSFAKSYHHGMTEAKKEATPNLDFFDGESMLALLKIYRTDRDERSRNAIYAALSHWERAYVDEYAKGLYLWAMTSMRLGYELFEDGRFATFADIHQALYDNYSPPRRVFFSNNRCATLEGMSQWMRLQQQLGVERNMHEKYLDFSLRRIARLQVSREHKLRVSYNGLMLRIAPRGIG
ncbi:hypothetical protein COV82_03980, partial [Candidatus Peregrinibacteria bacterium CG11_big_fil_rev_8_21_14_0_20_46_8]